MKFVGVATDCIAFKAYLPIVKNQQVTDVSEISSIDASKAPDTEVILWLDSIIFSQQKIRPTAEDLKWRFGPGSPTYSLMVDELNSLWCKVKDEEDVKLKLELWAKNMEIVYGSKPKEESFIAHTYLVSLVKMIVCLRLSGDSTASKEKIRSALTGEYLSSYGITNLIEEDYFTWLLHPRIVNETLDLCCRLTRELLRYDFSQIDEDFFKEIYQEIVERKERHRIGEYYTPEWLTELTLQEALDAWACKDKALPRILDAYCGSDTFLCNAVRWMNNVLGTGTQRDQTLDTLDTILNSVVGMDINPLAVTIARANYLIALGDLVNAGKQIVIPVYVSDSIKLPEAKTIWVYQANEGVEVYDIEVDGSHIQIPINIAKDRPKLGRVLNGFREAVEVYRKRKNKDEACNVFKKETESLLSAGEFEVFKMTLNTILGLIDKGRDAIWIFLINNMYAPVALMESKFDILVSNPPWIAMRYIENESYQDFIKEQVLNNYQLLKSNQVKLFTHMDTATLCYRMAADLYLKDSGVIGFVMPRSVLTGAFQHESFKSFKKPPMKLIKILDMEDVSPLFNVKSCVLIAIKGESTNYPVFARRYSGTLDRKNCRLSEAIKSLKVNDYHYKPPKALKYSYYHDKVKQGATIVPRNSWFVEFEVQPILQTIDVKKPMVKTSDEIKDGAKEPWKNVELEGNVEAEFIYCTILGGDIIPFGYTKMRPIVIPAEPSATGYSLLDVEGLRKRGAMHMADWLERAQQVWEERRTEKAKEIFQRVIDRLDYQRLLTVQNPGSKYVVIYNTSGTNLVSCVVSKQNLPGFNVGSAIISPRNFIADAKTYFYETDNELEARYICAVLNSDVVNKDIKPLQSMGLYGARDIHRRPFMLPVPKFDMCNPDHIRLAELSKECHKKVASLKITKTTSAGARKEAKKEVTEELKEINSIVSKLLCLCRWI